MRVSIDTAVLRALAAPRRRFAADGARRLELAGGQVGALERHAQLEKSRARCIGAIGSATTFATLTPGMGSRSAVSRCADRVEGPLTAGVCNLP